MYFGTLVWQVLEEGRLSTCKLYVYIYNIYRVLLCARDRYKNMKGKVSVLVDNNKLECPIE